MSITKFVQNAVYHLYGDFSVIEPMALQCAGYDDPVDQFIDQMRKVGAKVVVSSNNYYFSNAFGPISQRLCGKPRRDIRKSLAFLRIREYSNFNFRAKLGVAQHAAVFLDKDDMIQLQLLNECSCAKLYISSEDIYPVFSQANDLLRNTQTDGYYISGPQSLSFTPINLVRNIAILSVYVIRKEKDDSAMRKIFL